MRKALTIRLDIWWDASIIIHTFFYWNGPNRHDLYRNGKEVYYDGQFFPDLMVNEASNFMEDNSNNPFFMYFAVNMPHYLYQGDAKWLSYYND